MDLIFKQAQQSELQHIFLLLKSAALRLQNNNVNQWGFWLNPNEDKIKWIEEGLSNNEFFFIESKHTTIGMFRLSYKDLLYWGEQKDEANYIHSLVIKEEFSGSQIGKKVIDQIIKNSIKKGIYTLRLDCNALNKKLCKYYESQGFVKVGEIQMPHSLNTLFEKSLK